jgi:predicted esterase
MCTIGERGMTELSFAEFSNQIQIHFANSTFSEGLSLASQYVTVYPTEFPLINYWRICLAAKMNEKATAYKILETTLANGSWYSELILRQSPSLEILQGEEEFERLLGISLQMQIADPTTSVPMVVMRAKGACGPDGDGCPTIVFLHSNQETAQKNMPHWQSLADQGWLIALPQSSNALWADGYVWMDFESGAKEVEERYARLVQEYSVDTERLLLAGFSMGAEVALAMALSGRIEVQGFILIGPGGPFMDDLSLWEPFIEQAKDKGLRGIILMGLADATIPQDNIRTLVKTLNENGIACDLKTYPDLEHEYPDDFDEFLQEALKYILL